jgi:hypothetical protein
VPCSDFEGSCEFEWIVGVIDRSQPSVYVQQPMQMQIASFGGVRVQGQPVGGTQTLYGGMVVDFVPSGCTTCEWRGASVPPKTFVIPKGQNIDIDLISVTLADDALDYNGDFTVNQTDVNDLRQDVVAGQGPVVGTCFSDFDIDQDGDVDAEDVALVWVIVDAAYTTPPAADPDCADLATLETLTAGATVISLGDPNYDFRLDVDANGQLDSRDEKILNENIAHPADINNDGIIDFLDLNEALSCFNLPAEHGCAAADVNGDGVVDVADLNQVISNFNLDACP